MKNKKTNIIQIIISIIALIMIIFVTNDNIREIINTDIAMIIIGVLMFVNVIVLFFRILKNQNE